MDPRFRNLALAVIALGLATWALARLGLFEPAPPPLVRSAEALDRGRRVFERQCRHCHADIPLERRVAGWSAQRAWDTIGRLPEVVPAMPPFRGTPEERRDLAVFLAELGGGGAGPSSPSTSGSRRWRSPRRRRRPRAPPPSSASRSCRP